MLSLSFRVTRRLRAALVLCRVYQRLRPLKVGGVKPFREPAIDRREELVRLCPLALLLPEAVQAHGGTQLPRFGLLAAGDGEGLPEGGFGPGHIVAGLAQQALALQAIRLP